MNGQLHIYILECKIRICISNICSQMYLNTRASRCICSLFLHCSHFSFTPSLYLCILVTMQVCLLYLHAYMFLYFELVSLTLVQVAHCSPSCHRAFSARQDVGGSTIPCSSIGLKRVSLKYKTQHNYTSQIQMKIQTLFCSQMY